MEYEKMLRFRMKMLSKENLILKIKENTVFSTRGIAALFLLIFSSYTTASSTSVDEFDKKNPAQLRAMAINYKKSTEELQEQLSKRSASSSEEDVIATKENLGSALNEGGPFDSPIKKLNSRANAKDTPDRVTLRGEIVALQLTGNQAEDLAMVLQLFKRYADRKIATSDSTALVRRSGEAQPVIVDLSDILTALNYAAAGVFGQQMQSLCKQFYVPVSSLQQSKSPTIDLKAIGQKYVHKISQALEPGESLAEIVLPYRHEFGGNSLLIGMIDCNIQDVADTFSPSKKSETLIDVADELRDKFFEVSLLTCIHYISGNGNKRSVNDIISLTHVGRGQSISKENAIKLQRELFQIFYPTAVPSLRITEYELGGERTAARITEVEFPLLAYIPEVISGHPVAKFVRSLFSCVPPPSTERLLGNGSANSSSVLRINAEAEDA